MLTAEFFWSVQMQLRYCTALALFMQPVTHLRLIQQLKCEAVEQSKKTCAGFVDKELSILETTCYGFWGIDNTFSVYNKIWRKHQC